MAAAENAIQFEPIDQKPIPFEPVDAPIPFEPAPRSKDSVPTVTPTEDPNAVEAREQTAKADFLGNAAQALQNLNPAIGIPNAITAAARAVGVPETIAPNITPEIVTETPLVHLPNFTRKNWLRPFTTQQGVNERIGGGAGTIPENDPVLNMGLGIYDATKEFAEGMSTANMLPGLIAGGPTLQAIIAGSSIAELPTAFQHAGAQAAQAEEDIAAGKPVDLRALSHSFFQAGALSAIGTGAGFRGVLEGKVPPPSGDSPGTVPDVQPIPEAPATTEAVKQTVVDFAPAEPSVEMIRLFRGETKPKPPTSTESGKLDRETFEPEQFRGRWWTTDEATARRYLKSAHDQNGKLLYLDIPKSEAEAFLVKNVPGAIKHSLQPGSEYVLPVEFRSEAKPAEPAKAPEQPIEPKPQEVPNAIIEPSQTIPSPAGDNLLIAPAGVKSEAPIAFEAAVIPGARQFVEQDVIPKLEEAAKGLQDMKADFKALVSPASVSGLSKETAGMIRERAAELAQKDVQVREKFNDARKAFDKQDPALNIEFIDKMERGLSQPTSELTALATQLRKAFDERVDEVRNLGTDKLKEVIENYFPHIWKDPAQALPWYLRIFGKRSLRGGGNFLKHRSIDLTTYGIAAGLEPVSTNPIDLSLIKLHEMDKYVMGQKIISEMKEKGLLQFSRSDIPPDGFAKIDDRMANVVEYRPTTKPDGTPGPPERILRGHYYAPEEVARVLNNYLSPGLQRFQWYRALRWWGNSLNQAQLGLSGFHLQFTMIDTATSKLALGIEKLAKGSFKEGSKDVTKGIVGLPIANQLSAYLEGNKVLKEYTRPGSIGGEYTAIVDSLLKAGGRVEMPEFYRNNTAGNFLKAIRTGNYPGALLRAPFAAIEATSHPLMRIAVPRLKLGVFSDMARLKLAELGPKASKETLRVEMGKIWDEVDNRLGELVYDNLFWNKTLKDLLMVGVRAVGWNYGTIRAVGGGIKEMMPWEIAERVRKGDDVFNRKIAYVMSLPITVGLMGAVYQYLHTGKGPDEVKDYLMPKTGRKNPDGSPERVMFPSYLKDAYAYAKHPFVTIGHKANPQIAMVIDMLNNKDFYGTHITEPDDSFFQAMKHEAEFVTGQFVPFSISTAGKRVGKDAETKIESIFGIIKPPAELTRTKAMNEIMRYVAEQSPQGGRSHEDRALLDIKREIIEQAADGKDVAPQIKQAVQDLKLSKQQEKNIKKLTKEDMRLRLFKTLPVDQAVKVFKLADDEEKKLWTRPLNVKLVNGIHDNPRKAEEYRTIRKEISTP